MGRISGIEWIVPFFVIARAKVLSQTQNRTLPPNNNKHKTKNSPSPPAWCKRIMPNKHNVLLYLDRELVEKSREVGFNLSNTFQDHLKHLITQFSTVSS